VSQPLMPTGKRSGFQTHTATTESVVHADEKLTAFVELEAAIRACRKLSDSLTRFSSESASLNGSESARRSHQLPSCLLGAIRNPGNENACRNSGGICVAP
jgi:hypothetical protein